WLPLMSTIQVHFSPVLQPVCATGLQANWLSMAASRSCGLPPPPHAAAKATKAAPRIRFFIARLLWRDGTPCDNLPREPRPIQQKTSCGLDAASRDDDLGHANWSPTAFPALANDRRRRA